MTGISAASVKREFADPDPAARPMVRWWWFGPSVERDELRRELDQIAGAGFGGVEISYVYPTDHGATEFLSDDFLDDLKFAVDCARERGLRCDLTLGSGWPFGGPHIGSDVSARRLHWQRYEVTAAAVDIEVPVQWPGDMLIAAYAGEGSLQEPPIACLELPISDGFIHIPDGDGPRVVFLAFSQLTGQNVKRAAFGAEGLVLDHYSREATERHLHAIGDRLLDAVPAESLGSVFCDSLEVYGADWTPDLMVEFERRRGYDAQRSLYLLTIDGPGSDRLRVDFYRTLTELYEENFISVCREWAARRGVPFRIQSYGSPPGTVSSYRFADLVEGEGWGWTELTRSKWASSAAHLYDRSVASSEVWTWVHSPSFRATPLDLKGEANEHLLAGINQFVAHGWPYSPSGAEGIGWFFYAAGALGPRNPWWPAVTELTGYLHRLSWLLRQGEPVADVALYLPAADVYPRIGETLDLWRGTKAHVGDEIVRAIRASGYDFDLVDDDALRVLAPESARVVVVPFASELPEPTAAWLDVVREAGGVVIPVVKPGAEGVTPDGLADALSAALSPDAAIVPSVADVGVVHRRLEDGDLYFVANTGNARRDVTLVPRDARAWFERWDPVTGKVLEAGSADSLPPLTIEPYGSAVVVTSDRSLGEPRRQGGDIAIRSMPIDGPWTVSYVDDQVPVSLPVSLPHVWEAERSGYSGSAAYEAEITIESTADPLHRVLLGFGQGTPVGVGGARSREIRGSSFRALLDAPVREVAEVWLDERRMGVVWAPPYELDLTSALTPGVHRLRIVVSNTAANRLAADPFVAERTARAQRSYGRRFRLQDLDLVLDGVSSGLQSVPELRWTR